VTDRLHEAVRRQIESGAIVCPASRQRLHLDANRLLATPDGAISYGVSASGVPMLITNAQLLEQYARSSEQMNREYTAQHLQSEQRWTTRIRRNDYRTRASILAAAAVLEGLDDGAACVSIGGGPTRADPRYINLNIGPFPNVDLVGDAHQLPYADASVDAIHCEAVFEHLHSPVIAAAEIFRVLKKGGKAYICTPFLQAYHGYPHHYQNFTITGHIKLFEDAGLRVLSSGTCVGPVYVLRNMIAVFIANYAPRPLNRILRAGWSLLSMAIAPLDIVLRDRPNAFVMASTTFLVAGKA